MRRYGVNYAAAVNATAATVTNDMSITTGTTRGCQIYEVVLSNNGVPFDTQIQSDLFWVSALTAGSSIAPAVLEQGSAAAVTTFSSLPSAATTTGISLMSLAFNGRGSVRWLAGDPDSRFIVAAGGGATGSAVFQNQQSVSASSIKLLKQIYFAE